MFVLYNSSLRLGGFNKRREVISQGSCYILSGNPANGSLNVRAKWSLAPRGTPEVPTRALQPPPHRGRSPAHSTSSTIVILWNLDLLTHSPILCALLL